MESSHITVNEIDTGFMRRAMELAWRGRGHVSPNPMVGAVIVKDGRIIGEGWHRMYGGLHAEREALAACSEDPAGSTMYVTLEPCCHHGKQPPCTSAVVGAGIARVVVGIPDPNPLVSGKGIELLQAKGIEVVCGVLEEELRKQNRIFLKYITSRLPWVTMKSAMTFDGKIAARTGDSKWVTCEESRAFVQSLRSWHSAIMAGIGTVRADDPLLNCRLDGARSPLRIIVDTNATLELSSTIVSTARQYKTAIAFAEGASSPEASAELLSRVEALEDAGVEAIGCRRDPVTGNVDLGDLFARLGQAGIDSVLVEGGAEINWSIVAAGLADEYYCFIAPKIVGGSLAKGPVGGEGFGKMSEAAGLRIDSVRNIGNDILVHAFFPLFRSRTAVAK